MDAPPPPPPLACQVQYTYSLWYNVLFYVTLGMYLHFDTDAYAARWRGVALHALPVWAVAQYIVWRTKIGIKCKRSPALILFSDIAWHWVPLAVTIGLTAARDRVRRVAPDPAFLFGAVGGLLAAYLGLLRVLRGGVFPAYHVPLRALAALYLPFFFLACALWWPLPPQQPGACHAAGVDGPQPPP